MQFGQLGLRKVIGGITLVVLLVAIPFTLGVISQQQDIRQRADENQLVCEPTGGMDKKYSSNGIKVTNNRQEAVKIFIQENHCPYTGQTLKEGSQCNTFVSRKEALLAPGESQTFKMDIPKCSYGQLDVDVVSETDKGCFTPEEVEWQGGLAFALDVSGNQRNCSNKTTPTPKPSTPPSCPVPGKVDVKIDCPFCQ